ncbi:hypothetical protein, partial [Staphylococcus aureus]|uniref:hypothetical protein n=1 Tax=Staphylococcus aureus TaxID=1280 RepID=UPI0039BE5498
DKKDEERRILASQRREELEAFRQEAITKDMQRASMLDQQLYNDIARIQARQDAELTADQNSLDFALKIIDTEAKAEQAQSDKDLKNEQAKNK